MLERLHGRQIAQLQVFGINSLKSVAPALDVLEDEIVITTEVAGRVFKVRTPNLTVTCDLQRAGRLLWLESAEPESVAAGRSRPTARLRLADGAALDLTEPARTKRITVTLARTSE